MHIAIKGQFGQVLWIGAFGQQSMACIITALELACADRDTVNGARKIPAIKQVARKKRMAEQIFTSILSHKTARLKTVEVRHAL